MKIFWLAFCALILAQAGCAAEKYSLYPAVSSAGHYDDYPSGARFGPDPG